MINKALAITLMTMLGACSNGDEATRSSANSAPQKSSNTQIGAIISSQQNVAVPIDNAQVDEFIAGEEAMINEIETIIEDEFEELEAESEVKITLQQGTEGQVEWLTPDEMSQHASEMLIVTPDGERITRKFAAGQSMALNESLPDGLYKWESTVTPELDPYVKEEMLSVRESGDLQAQQDLAKKFRAQGAFPSKKELKDNRQSGAFVVRDGIATPTSSESSGQDERG